MSQNIINRGVLIRFVGNSHVYQARESSRFIAACGIGAHKALFIVSIYLLWNFLEIKISGSVNLLLHAFHLYVPTIYNEIAQYLKFFMFFPGVTIMTSAS